MNISVIGTGSFGTSLSMVLNDNNNRVMMYGRNQDTVQEINERHTNSRYLKDIKLSETITATASLKEAAAHAELLVLAVPVNAMRSVASDLNGYLEELNKQVLVVHVAKGLELNTYKRVSEVLEEVFDEARVSDICVLSGPSHAEEVALKQPTTVSTASLSEEGAEIIQDVFMTDYFRVYVNNDMVGVEIGGALKNIVALAVGALAGYGFGDNPKAAVITRGLHEIARLGTKLGANPLTFLGLAGMGDLIVTATSQHSRNYRCGQMLAGGLTLKEATEQMGMVVEGVNTTRAAYELSEQHDVEMPITKVLYGYLFNGISEDEAFTALMKREKTSESEGLKQLLESQIKNSK
ncbi:MULTISPECIES: NAD(P)H-dependent glycerol-3-phosphate dehydrogenase [Jeotgalicoccus]|jgi:Glycerol-3-phosphate dehydrogenase|uniref:Glycerol-3-phosphate dehydrogenase [NAD(P)+] n=1 Tax=Jeotgalicoccus nanhaiensis TaxID=568603 RepID=A0ABR9XWS1_9STAP|nr:NAD(P)H-dependent glycerol-3-phosphate dehydrogenase [Jeotgalicoccus nanhaiensis]MBF0753367.1 NAD(P)H-dependent glycerol-3-phosphate dehydrogenase [Jeotgalicoccus nanhaiensis]TFU62531.1 NAD(P)H-dependent glycerol-3-phosphate dehydrogenase [Jeotgalicoccus nanhaiensis]